MQAAIIEERSNPLWRILKWIGILVLAFFLLCAVIFGVKMHHLVRYTAEMKVTWANDYQNWMVERNNKKSKNVFVQAGTGFRKDPHAINIVMHTKEWEDNFFKKYGRESSVADDNKE